MNLPQMIHADFIGIRQLLATSGNAPQPSGEMRHEGMEAVLAVWRTHGRMLREVVLPTLDPGLAGRIEAGWRDVESGFAKLAGQGLSGTDGWLDDFTRAKAAFEAQSLAEELDMVDTLLRLPSEQLADMTKRARAIAAGETPAGSVQAASGAPAN